METQDHPMEGEYGANATRPRATNSPKSASGFVCKICQQTFLKKVWLYRHEMNSHQENLVRGADSPPGTPTTAMDISPDEEENDSGRIKTDVEVEHPTAYAGEIDDQSLKKPRRESNLTIHERVSINKDNSNGKAKADDDHQAPIRNPRAKSGSKKEISDSSSFDEYYLNCETLQVPIIHVKKQEMMETTFPEKETEIMSPESYEQQKGGLGFPASPSTSHFCNKCGKGFASLSSLNGHLGYHGKMKKIQSAKAGNSSDDDDDYNVKDDEKSYACSSCKRVFDCQRGLVQHWRWVHSEGDKKASRRKDDGKDKGDGDGEKSYECEDCKMKFTTKQGIGKHRRWTHAHLA